MKKETKKFLLLFLALYLIIGLIVLFAYLIPHLQQRKEDSWYKTEVQQAALDYVAELVDDTTKKGVLGYFYPSLDKEIVKNNRDLSNEEKVYPFTWVEVSVAAGRDIYIFKMNVVSRGEFEITDVKKENNDKYFTYW